MPRNPLLLAVRKGALAKNFTPDWKSSATAASSCAHFSHDADIGVVGIGPTKAKVFRQAALALTAVVTDPTSVKPPIERDTGIE
jgi:hypothetical protein